MQLWQYLFIAMKAMTQLPGNCAEEPRMECQSWAEVHAEAPEEAEVRYQEIAHQIAGEAVWRKIVEQGKHTDIALARHALNVLFLAGAESGFSILVDNGTCNKRNLVGKDFTRVKRLGGCDGGHAYSMWQMHPDLITDAAQGIRGINLIEDRAKSISIAWDLHRIRPKAWSTWRWARALTSHWEASHSLQEISLQ